MDKNIKLIRQIIRSRHGGLEEAPDSAILAVWNALNPDDQIRYLADYELERKSNAVIA